MTLVDARGRLFGRLNLFDAAIVGFALLLVPIAYGTYLLFRTPRPRVTSVRRVEITKEERRVGGPGLTAKLKVLGSGLRPMLRASVDEAPAIGFVFENPNSADVLVGAVPAGSHDLVLYDGAQEVARAPGAVTIQAAPPPRVRLVGTILALDKATADALETGGRFPAGEPLTEIVQLGPVHQDRRRLTVGARSADLPIDGAWARDAVVGVRCDPDPTGDNCTIGGKPLSATPQPIVAVAGPAGPLTVAVAEVLPDTPPHAGLVRVRFEGSRELIELVRIGDRDLLLDDRAARVTELGARQSAGDKTALDVTLSLGTDPAGDEWRYRGRGIKPGSTFTLSTSRYVATGSVLAVSFDDPSPPKAGKP